MRGGILFSSTEMCTDCGYECETQLQLHSKIPRETFCQRGVETFQTNVQSIFFLDGFSHNKN